MEGDFFSFQFSAASCQLGIGNWQWGNTNRESQMANLKFQKGKSQRDSLAALLTTDFTNCTDENDCC